MAGAKPDDVTNPAEAGDSDRGNNPTEPADPDVLDSGLSEGVHESHATPSTGADVPEGGPVVEGGPGSTGLGANDSGGVDAGGEPGGASAGSSGG